jgi:6-phosphogluconolactonase
MPASAPSALVAYVGNAGSSDIHVLRISPGDGAMHVLEKVPFPGMVAGGGSLPMAVSPDRRFLYVALRGEPLVVAAFRVEPESGRLTHLGNALLADSMAYISMDRSGRFLFGASYGGNKVAVNAVGADGAVGAVLQVMPTAPNAHAILADPANRHVLVTSLGGDLVHQLAFDPVTGRLAANDPPFVRLPARTGPRHLAFHPDNGHAYLLGELDGSVTVFGYDAEQGRLERQQSVTIMPEGFAGRAWGADVHLDPAGAFLYASERTSSTLSVFRVGPRDGTLARMQCIPTETQPRSFAIDPTGRHLLVAGQLSNCLTHYAIAPDTGQLTERSRIPVGASPDWVEIIALP